MFKLANKLFAKAQHSCHRHAAIVYRGSNIVAAGFNHDYIHAEVAALKKLWPDQRAGVRVVSLRITKAGNLGLAKPCPACEAFMRENGVKSVTYSDNDGKMIKMRLQKS
jgi:cytidine deaminase